MVPTGNIFCAHRVDAAIQNTHGTILIPSHILVLEQKSKSMVSPFHLYSSSLFIYNSPTGRTFLSGTERAGEKPVPLFTTGIWL
jgi:hypothetical protein